MLSKLYMSSNILEHWIGRIVKKVYNIFENLSKQKLKLKKKSRKYVTGYVEKQLAVKNDILRKISSKFWIFIV